MKLSVIMPVYNVEEYLSQSIESVLSQDTDDIEIICIDDCSNDNSYNILLKYAAQDSRIKVFKNEQNTFVDIVYLLKTLWRNLNYYINRLRKRIK